MAEPLDEYDQLCLSIGRMSRCWAMLDRELNALLHSILNITAEQLACITTEMSDVAQRCRAVKTTSHTIDVPQAWRSTLTNLCNCVANRLSPARNRHIHDIWYELPDTKGIFRRIDRRVKLTRAQAFQDLVVGFDSEHPITVGEVDELGIKAIAASVAMATGRFDLTAWRETGRFPERPQLTPERVAQIDLLRLQPDQQGS